MSYLHSLISHTRDAKQIAAEGSFLIIFGYEEGFKWEGWIFGSHNWIKLKEEHGRL